MRWRRFGTGLLVAGAVSAHAAQAPEDAQPAEGTPAELEVTLFGPVVPRLDVEPIALFYDDNGDVCVVDPEGLSCLDDEGEETWGVDLDGVRDARVGVDGVAVLTSEGWVVVADRSITGVRSGRPLLDAQGRLAWEEADQVRTADGDTRALPVSDPWAVVLHTDGQIGVVDPDGRWLPGGSLEDPAELDLGQGGWLQVESLPGGGVAALDADGLLLFEDDGRVRAELDVRGSTLRVVDDGVWVSGQHGVLEVGPQGDVEVIWERPVLDAAVAGERWSLIEVGGQIRSHDGNGPVGGVQHEAAIRALAPRPDGGAASVDEDGVVLIWTPGGEPRRVDGSARDVAWDGAGGLWLADGGTLVRLGAEGERLEVAMEARMVVGLSDGVLVGDGAALSRIGLDGELAWRVDEAHQERPWVDEVQRVALVRTPSGVSVLDLVSGARRRRLPLAGRDVRAAGVAVGGLVVVGRLEEDGRMGGWRPGRAPRTGFRPPSPSRASLSPNGRWVAWADRDELVVRNLEGWPVLGRGERPELPERPEQVVAADGRVWIGRDDGRIERWEVGAAVGDPEVPRFTPYAQLDAFTPAPELPGEPSVLVEGSVAHFASHRDGTLAIGPDLALRRPGVATVVPAVDPPVQAVSFLWDPRWGLLIGASDGRVLRFDDAGEPTPLREADGRAIVDLCVQDDALMAATPGSVLRLSGPGSGLADLEGEAMAAPTPWTSVWQSSEADRTADLACGAQNALIVRSGERLVPIGPAASGRVHPGGARSARFLPDGTLASGGQDETVILWDPGRPQPLYVLEGHGAPVTHLSVDAAGHRLIAGTAGRGAVVWDLLALAPLGRLLDDTVVDGVEIDPEGRYVTVAGQGVGLVRQALPAAEVKPAGVEVEAP